MSWANPTLPPLPQSQKRPEIASVGTRLGFCNGLHCPPRVLAAGGVKPQDAVSVQGYVQGQQGWQGFWAALCGVAWLCFGPPTHLAPVCFPSLPLLQMCCLTSFQHISLLLERETQGLFAAKNPDEHGAFEWGETEGRQAAGKPWQSHGGVVTKALRKGKAGQGQGTEEEGLTGLRMREGTVTSGPSLTGDMHRLCGCWGHGLWVILLKGQKCPPSNATLAGTQELGVCECQQEGPIFRNLGLGPVRAIPAPATPHPVPREISDAPRTPAA